MVVSYFKKALMAVLLVPVFLLGCFEVEVNDPSVAVGDTYGTGTPGHTEPAPEQGDTSGTGTPGPTGAAPEQGNTSGTGTPGPPEQEEDLEYDETVLSIADVDQNAVIRSLEIMLTGPSYLKLLAENVHDLEAGLRDPNVAITTGILEGLLPETTRMVNLLKSLSPGDTIDCSQDGTVSLANDTFELDFDYCKVADDDDSDGTYHEVWGTISENYNLPPGPSEGLWERRWESDIFYRHIVEDAQGQEIYLTGYANVFDFSIYIDYESANEDFQLVHIFAGVFEYDFQNDGIFGVIVHQGNAAVVSESLSGSLDVEPSDFAPELEVRIKEDVRFNAEGRAIEGRVRVFVKDDNRYNEFVFNDDIDQTVEVFPHGEDPYTETYTDLFWW